MEELEVVPKTSDIHNYLKDIGYNDVPTQGDTQERLEVTKTRKIVEKGVTEYIDADTVEQVKILLNSDLLFCDDKTLVNNLINNFEVTRKNVLRSMFSGFFSFFILSLGFYFYFLVGGFVFVFISAYFSYRASDYLWRKHFKRKRLNDLVAILQENYKLYKKILLFILENSQILDIYSCLNSDPTDVFINQLKYFKNLEKDFVKIETRSIKIFQKHTKELVFMFPIFKSIADCLVVYTDDDQQNVNNLSRMHQIYLLHQSEFLQRLAYCLIPNIQVKKENNERSLEKVILKLTHEMFQLNVGLDKDFKYLFLNGIQKEELKCLPKETQDTKSGKLLLNIHETSNILQKLLLHTRTVEHELENNRINDNIERNLKVINDELENCKVNIDHSFILYTQMTSPGAVTDDVNEESISVQHETKEVTEIGYSELDQQVEDDVFEAYIPLTDNNEKKFDSDDGYLTVEDKNKNKLEKEYSKNVLLELKSKLIPKAKEWEEREDKVLKKKGLFDETKRRKDLQNIETKIIDDMSKSENVFDIPTNEDSPWPLPHFKRCSIRRQKGRIQNKVQPREVLDTQECNINNAIPSLLAQSILQVSCRFNNSVEDTFTLSGESSGDEAVTH